MNWELLADGKPVRLGCRWVRAMDCPRFNQYGPYIGGPGTLALALVGRTLFYVNVGERLPGFRKTGIDAASFGPPLRPRRRLENRKAFREAVKAARKHWAAYLASFAADLPPLYRNPFQRLADRWLGPRLSVGQMLLASEREIKWLRHSPSQVKYVRETIVVCDVPNSMPTLPGKEIIAHSVIDASQQATAGVTKWLARVWYLDHSLPNADYFDGATHPPIGKVIRPTSILAGHESLPYQPPRKCPPLGDDDKQRLDFYKQKHRNTQ